MANKKITDYFAENSINDVKIAGLSEEDQEKQKIKGQIALLKGKEQGLKIQRSMTRSKTVEQMQRLKEEQEEVTQRIDELKEELSKLNLKGDQ